MQSLCVASASGLKGEGDPSLRVPLPVKDWRKTGSFFVGIDGDEDTELRRLTGDLGEGRLVKIEQTWPFLPPATYTPSPRDEHRHRAMVTRMTIQQRELSLLPLFDVLQPAQASYEI